MRLTLCLALSLVFATSCSEKNFLIEDPMAIENNSDGTSRIIVVSHHTLDGNYLDYTFANHRAYTKKHKYDYWFRNGVIDKSYEDKDGKNDIFKNGLYWQKIATVQQALDLKTADGKRRYDWVMWIDADALFTDQDKTIESELAQLTKDEFLVISHDYLDFCLNTGIWMIKNDDRGHDFMRLVTMSFPYFKANQYPEQQAVQDLVFGFIDEKAMKNNSVAPYENRQCKDTTIIPHVKVLRQRALNSYYTDYAVGKVASSWQPGDYIAHAAAGGDKRSWLHRLTTCMKEKGNDLRGCEVGGAWKEGDVK